MGQRRKLNGLRIVITGASQGIGKALAEAAARCAALLDVELSNGQMLEDVRLAVNGKVPVEFYSRVGGNVPLAEEIYDELLSRLAALA